LPFKHFLTFSRNFEQTQQVILQCLLNDPGFLKLIIGPVAGTIDVKLEPFNRLFDIGLFKGEECIGLIELKMWSALSGGQVEYQWKFLEREGCPGLHILLGTSYLQFHKDDTYDELAEYTYDHSKKIGYPELIRLLDRFLGQADPATTVARIAADYRAVLQEQQVALDHAWLDDSAPLHHRCFSLYQKVRAHLTDEQVYTYTVNNGGGADYILNDEDAPSPFSFRDYDFEAYQEMVNFDFVIRLSSPDAPNDVRKELKGLFLQKLLEKGPPDIPWSFDCKTSKLHKIALYRPPATTLDDCERIADLFKTLNPVIKEIVAELPSP
jgi:hypothetical protein